MTLVNNIEVLGDYDGDETPVRSDLPVIDEAEALARVARWGGASR